MSQTDRPQGRAYHKGPVVMRGAQVPSSTTDQRLLDSRGTADWVHTDPWRVLRIQAEFVEGFGALAELGPAVSVGAVTTAALFFHRLFNPIGAVLMMRFAAQAAPFFDSVEIVELHHQFHGRVKVSFGWGTLLTNDFRGLVAGDGLAPFSLVCKAVSANGRPTVKLSDNPAKATGPAAEIARYRRVFDVGQQSAVDVVV